MNLWSLASNYVNGIATLRDWLGEGGIVTDNETAQKRTDICLGCEHNVAGNVVADSVGKAIKAQVELRNAAGLRTKGIKSLHTCRQCSCYLPLKVFCPIEFVQKHWADGEKEKLEAAAPWCWQLDKENVKQELHYACTKENLKLFTNKP